MLTKWVLQAVPLHLLARKRKNLLFQNIFKSFNEVLKYSYKSTGNLKGLYASLRSPISLLQYKRIF